MCKRGAMQKPPPAVDRTIADLRTRLQTANWSTDAQLCLELRRWYIASQMIPAVAAAEIAVPHITSDVFRKLESFRFPLGHTNTWHELINLYNQGEALRQATALVGVAAMPAKLAADPKLLAHNPKPQRQPERVLPPVCHGEAPDFDALIAAVEKETNTRGGAERRSKTPKTAEMIRDALKSYARPATQWLKAAPGFNGLAAALALHQGGNSVDAKRWYARLYAYRSFMTDTSIAQLTAPTVVAPTRDGLPNGVPAKLSHKILGRPRLLDDGSYEVTVQATFHVKRGDKIWPEVVAAVNA